MTDRPELAWLPPEFREFTDDELAYLLALDSDAQRKRHGLDEE